MPKLKTHSGSKDRIKLSKTGKLQHRHATRGHFLEKKGAARKRGFAGTTSLVGKNRRNIKRKLGI